MTRDFGSRQAETVTRAGGLPGATLRRVLEHMSTFHFARLFEKSTGQSPHRFAVERRIEDAKGLLADGALSIAAISRLVGFRTPSHFTTGFRRTTGTTASAYRARAVTGLR